MIQDRRGLWCEQATIVGRQPDRLIALVDLAEQLDQTVVVVAGGGGEGVALGHAACDILTYPLAQAVVIVARVVDRQQSAILRVEHEQHPVEEDQRGRADIGQVVGTCGIGDRRHQAREHALEHHAGQVLCYRFLIAAPFRDGGLEEGAGGRALHRKGGATEQQEEGPQGIVVAGPQHIGHIDLEEAARPRTCAPVIQPPHAAVGKDSKPDASLRSDIRARQIAQQLPCGVPPRSPSVRSR